MKTGTVKKLLSIILNILISLSIESSVCSDSYRNRMFEIKACPVLLRGAYIGHSGQILVMIISVKIYWD